MIANHIMYRLFHSFEDNNILYLHFKSNTNLSKSFEGKADFDVLIDKNRITDIERIIIGNNGKRHNPPHIGNYPGVDNWLIFDDQSGIIYHLHLHYQLATGKPLVKDYIIPWCELLFKTRIKDPEFDVYITDPNVELLLLTFRHVLKAHLFDRIKKIIGIYRLEKGMKEEWDDLYHKISPTELEKYANIVCPNHAGQVTEILLKNKLSCKDYLRLHKYVRKTMSVHRRCNCYEATVRSAIYRRIVRIRKIWYIKFGGVPITKKISLQGGLIVAFVGVDGAGKSTVSNEIARWIKAGKIECKRFYMGAGDGQTTILSSLIKKILNKGKSINNKTNTKVNILKNPSTKKPQILSFYRHPLQFIHRYIRLLEINSIQRNNTKKILKMHRYRLNGGISILDRWPQIEIEGQNDGPKMFKFEEILGKRRFVRNLMKKEKENLDIVKTVKPDLIFRLNISLDTCMLRKTEHKNRDAFGRKLNELNRLTFQSANIIEIDAELPYDEELLIIKRILWQYV